MEQQTKALRGPGMHRGHLWPDQSQQQPELAKRPNRLHVSVLLWALTHIVVELYRRLRDWMPSLTAGPLSAPFSGRWRRRGRMHLPLAPQEVLEEREPPGDADIQELSYTDFHGVLDAVHNKQAITPCSSKVQRTWALPIADCCKESWSWHEDDKSHEVNLIGTRNEVALFHPNWSNGTAGVRGSKALDRNCKHYWEVYVSQRIFGTSMMFGVASRPARMHVDAFVNLLGEDDNSWGLSHKGLLWHGGNWRHYCPPFPENEATVIGVLYDGPQGTLTFYKDGKSLGVAFSNLNSLSGDGLFPAVASTAAKTEMTLGETVRSFQGLQDRCRASIVGCISEPDMLQGLPLPPSVKLYLRDGMA